MKLVWDFYEEEINQEPVIRYYSNGQKEYEYWFLDGKKHREDGPAVQKWYENGQKWYEDWYLSGKYHREDGPAVQQWFVNGQKEYDLWYLNGKRIFQILFK